MPEMDRFVGLLKSDIFFCFIFMRELGPSTKKWNKSEEFLLLGRCYLWPRAGLCSTYDS